VRCCFFIDAGQHSTWTEYLDVLPTEGQAVEHDGHTYVVNPNPVHTWYEQSEEMVMLTLTTLDDHPDTGN
jgi:hypothetical protein